MERDTYKLISFDLFRYQLLPITQNAQINLFGKELTLEELIERKNKIFHEVITLTKQYFHPGYDTHHKILINRDDWFVFKIGSKKSVERENENFVRESIESWPSVTVIINNNPDIQIIAISNNKKAFTTPKVVSNIIQNTLKENINNNHLSLHIKDISDSRQFWDIVRKHEGRIEKVKFELISPNMANISKSLKVDLKQINKDTNSHIMNLELNAVKGSTLDIKRENEMIDGIVDYASEGGGDISLKIKKIKHTIHTKKTNKTIELDEFEVNSININTLNAIIQAFKT